MRREFEVHKLNVEGMAKASRIAVAFCQLLSELENMTGIAPDSRGEGAREMALVRTHLELACFYGKKACAIQARNREEVK